MCEADQLALRPSQHAVRRVDVGVRIEADSPIGRDQQLVARLARDLRDPCPVEGTPVAPVVGRPAAVGDDPHRFCWARPSQRPAERGVGAGTLGVQVAGSGSAEPKEEDGQREGAGADHRRRRAVPRGWLARDSRKLTPSHPAASGRVTRPRAAMTNSWGGNGRRQTLGRIRAEPGHRPRRRAHAQ